MTRATFKKKVALVKQKPVGGIATLGGLIIIASGQKI